MTELKGCRADLGLPGIGGLETGCHTTADCPKFKYSDGTDGNLYCVKIAKCTTDSYNTDGKCVTEKWKKELTDSEEAAREIM